MAISYNVYANDGAGGAVNYGTPIATTAALTHTTAPLAASSDSTFAVRAFDATSGIEEANTEALVRIVLDAAGNDVSARPNGVLGLSATPTAAGSCWVAWGYHAAGQGGPPSQFNVYLTAGPTPSLATPAATVPYQPGVIGYGCSVAGLAGAALTTVAVRAVGPSASLAGPVATVVVDGRISPLSAVDALSATAMA